MHNFRTLAKIRPHQHCEWHRESTKYAPQCGFLTGLKHSGAISAIEAKRILAAYKDRKQKGPLRSGPLRIHGAVDRTRTGDLLITSELLYQLSHNAAWRMSREWIYYRNPRAPSRTFPNFWRIFFEKAEQENYPNATFERRTARSRQVPHIALKQRRRVPRYASRRLKGNMGCMTASQRQ